MLLGRLPQMRLQRSFYRLSRSAGSKASFSLLTQSLVPPPLLPPLPRSPELQGSPELQKQVHEQSLLVKSQIQQPPRRLHLRFKLSRLAARSCHRLQKGPKILRRTPCIRGCSKGPRKRWLRRARSDRSGSLQVGEVVS
jgi:hypothetical protein